MGTGFGARQKLRWWRRTSRRELLSVARDRGASRLTCGATAEERIVILLAKVRPRRRPSRAPCCWLPLGPRPGMHKWPNRQMIA